MEERVSLTAAEREVWLRILRESWPQMQALFPRLAAYNDPPLPAGLRRRGQADTFIED